MHHARSTIVILGLVAALGVSACGSTAGQGGAYGGGGLTTKPPTTELPTTTAVAAGGAAAGGAASATIAGYAFRITGSPTAGTALTVTNSDSVGHTFTSADGGVDAKVPAGGTAQVTFAKAGTFTVVCKIHGSMKASVTVG
jgi:plastocyanin